jgi:fido (protein-threonine AMPylation protein)
MTTGAPPRFSRSPHLDALIEEAERLGRELRSVPGERRVLLAHDRGDECTIATLRLDGSPMEHLPDLESTGGTDATPAGTARSGTWLDAMGLGGEPSDERIQALEALGVRAALGSDDLGERLLTDTIDALEELHRRLTLGLVHAERAGAPRVTEQAVHDASLGRIIFYASPPETIADELAGLSSWLDEAGRAEHPLVVSGLLHLELLRVHPYDAANGRLARAASRLLLRARGLDPDGLACPEPELAADAIGYHEEVARTRRRRDATIWLERWAEAVAAGMRRSALRLRTDAVSAPDDALRVLGGLDDDFTLADYRDRCGTDTSGARTELSRLLDAGCIERVPASRGLRFVRLPGARH